jgi:hypothetical protein
VDELEKIVKEHKFRVKINKEDVIGIEGDLMVVIPSAVGPRTAVCEYEGVKWWLEATYPDRVMFRMEVGAKRRV